MSRSRVPSRSPLRFPLGAHLGDVVQSFGAVPKALPLGELAGEERASLRGRTCTFDYVPGRSVRNSPNLPFHIADFHTVRTLPNCTKLILPFRPLSLLCRQLPQSGSLGTAHLGRIV